MSLNASRAMIMAALSFLVLSFQNCGGYGSANVGTDLSSNVPNGGAGVPVDTDRFKAGDAFLPSKIPYVPQGTLVQELNDYPTVTGFKAVAVAANGYGVARGSTKFASQAEANKLVVEACQLVANNQPCALFAEGGVIKYNESEFLLKHVSVLEVGARALDFNKVPMILASHAAALIPAYAANTSPFKAVALGLYGAVPFFGGLTQAEANRRVLQTCEALKPERTCTLYAENNAVVFNVTSFNWNTSQRYIEYGPRAFDAGKVPFVDDATRLNSYITGIPTYAAQGQNPVLAVSREGHWWMVYHGSQTLAQNRAQALASCNGAIAAGRKVKCVVYSENNQVVLNATELAAANLP